MDIGFVQELYKVEAARSRGEPISEFKIARLYVDSMWIEMTEMLDSGIPKNDLVGMLMITARVSRAAAYNTLTNKINSAAKRKTKGEVSKKVGEAKLKPAPAPVAPASKPVQPTVVPVVPPSSPFPNLVEPKMPATVPATATTEISASTESDQGQPFQVGIKIGSNFAGVDYVGRQAEQEREERRKSLANLESMEAKYGSPDKFK